MTDVRRVLQCVKHGVHVYVVAPPESIVNLPAESLAAHHVIHIPVRIPLKWFPCTPSRSLLVGFIHRLYIAGESHAMWTKESPFPLLIIAGLSRALTRFGTVPFLTKFQKISWHQRTKFLWTCIVVIRPSPNEPLRKPRLGHTHVRVGLATISGVARGTNIECRVLRYGLFKNGSGPQAYDNTQDLAYLDVFVVEIETCLGGAEPCMVLRPVASHPSVVCDVTGSQSETA